MVVARKAPVKPRISSNGALPLEDEILSEIESRNWGVVYLYGPIGSGKTTALQHLAAVLPPDAPVDLLDERDVPTPALGLPERLLVRAVTTFTPNPRDRVLALLPWNVDELIEYLLHVHHDRCAAVMSRVTPEDHELCGGSPDLWVIVLDELAKREDHSDGRAAFKAYLEAHVGGVDRRKAQALCLELLMQEFSSSDKVATDIVDFSPEAWRVLRHPEVQLVLAAESLASNLRTRTDDSAFRRQLPRELVVGIAAELGDGPPEHLRILASRGAAQPMAASILRFADPSWKPDPVEKAQFELAYLTGAVWSSVVLPNADFRQADLGHINLCDSNLDGADLSHANLAHAQLHRASLDELTAVSADFSNADLRAISAAESNWDAAKLHAAVLDDADLNLASFRETDLTGASFRWAILAGASLSGAVVNETDFSGADLSNASFGDLDLRLAQLRGVNLSGADLPGCNLEDQDLAGAFFANANLRNALLTAADLRGADFTGACLRETGLGDVNLEGACLLDADLRGATFHMGSTRSGMLFTPIASEGSRTGFYTDDADDQHFKAPEEIRKANLRGADLRGAQIENVDFYLVDLRGAIFDAKQARHFRRCRAILDG